MYKRQAHKRVLVIAEEGQFEKSLMHRVGMGLPDQVERRNIGLERHADAKSTADKVVAEGEIAPFDVIIACGSARAIAHGRKSRHAIAQAGYANLSKSERRSAGLRSMMPDFFAVPGVDGLPDPCMSSGAASGIKTMPPTVIICDPTLLRDATPEDCASAFAMTLGRCLAAFWDSGFNPLADGMAVEGLRRLAKLTPLTHEQLRMQSKNRDLMAASLNGAISQQKGPGLVPALNSALRSQSGDPIDFGAVQSILLPHLLRDTELLSETDEALISRVLGLDGDLPDSLERLFDPMPLSKSLPDLGITVEDWHHAVDTAQSRVHVPASAAQRLNQLVDTLF